MTVKSNPTAFVHAPVGIVLTLWYLPPLRKSALFSLLVTDIGIKSIDADIFCLEAI